MYQEWFKEHEKIKNTVNKTMYYNKQIKQIKRKSKAFDKITKLCKKYNLELSRLDDILIIKGILDYGGNSNE